MKTTSELSFSEALNYRRSVRLYNPAKPIDSNIVKHCIEQATLAPNSSNMQLWEFHHIASKELVQQFAPLCFNQNAAKTAQELVVVVVRKDLWKKRAKLNLEHVNKQVKGKNPEDYSGREKMAMNYYKKVMPFVYGDFLGIFGFLKYLATSVMGLFRPAYRNIRNCDMRIVAHKSAGLAAQTFMLAMAAQHYDTCPMEGTDTLRIKKLLKLPASAEINMTIACGIRDEKGVYGERFRIPFDQVYTKW